MTRYMDFLVPLLKTADVNSPIDLTFLAVAFAAFRSRPNTKALLPQADQYYVNALNAINTALRDPARAKDDATLASVMLMSTYEVEMSVQFLLKPC